MCTAEARVAKSSQESAIFRERKSALISQKLGEDIPEESVTRRGLNAAPTLHWDYKDGLWIHWTGFSLMVIINILPVSNRRYQKYMGIKVTQLSR